MNTELLMLGIIITLIINGLAHIICGTTRAERPSDNYGGWNVFFGLIYIVWAVVVILT